MAPRPFFLIIAVLIAAQFAGSQLAVASEQAEKLPAWLQAHVGTGDGKIASIVLKRARALHQRKTKEGAIKNPCYMAMDATKPSTSRGGALGRRFYVICEAKKSFRAIYSGYGNGRKLKKANFSNGRQCAKNFSNAEGSKLTTGGSYVTAEERTSFKGYHLVGGKRKPLLRTFLLFDGEGDTANARERDIGGHGAFFLRWQCRYKHTKSKYADKDGFVPYGRFVSYTGGRSNGCTTWSRPETAKILTMVKEDPTTIYIYPESSDINAVAKAIKAKKSLASAGLYWNKTCLKAIKTPKFWPLKTLQPIINEWRDSLPKGPWRPLPICK